MSSTALDSLPVGYNLQNYEIGKTLGRGGFGITYLARDHDLNTDVAIKEFFPFGKAIRGDDMHLLLRSADDADMYSTQLDRFIEEARALAQFNHPSIVRVRRLIEDNDTAYFVMDFVQGGTLGEYIETKGAVDPSQVKKMVRQLVEGLIVVHDVGMVHRDIKPDNILLPYHSGGKASVKKGKVDITQPILIDFGTARQLNDNRSATNYVSAGFAPIEQYTSRSTPDARSDIYALSAVTYAALAAEVPADPSTRQLEPESLIPAAKRFKNKLDMQFLEALDAGLAIKPTNRPDDMREFRQKLFGSDALTIKVEKAPEAQTAPEIEQEKDVEESPQPTGIEPEIHQVPAGKIEQKGNNNNALKIITALAVLLIVFGGGYAIFGDSLKMPNKPQEVIVTAETGQWTPVMLNGAGELSITSDGPFRIRDGSDVFLIDGTKPISLSSINPADLEVKALDKTRNIKFTWVEQ